MNKITKILLLFLFLMNFGLKCSETMSDLDSGDLNERKLNDLKNLVNFHIDEQLVMVISLYRDNYYFIICCNHNDYLNHLDECKLYLVIVDQCSIIPVNADFYSEDNSLRIILKDDSNVTNINYLEFNAYQEKPSFLQINISQQDGLFWWNLTFINKLMQKGFWKKYCQYVEMKSRNFERYSDEYPNFHFDYLKKSYDEAFMPIKVIYDTQIMEWL